MLALCLSAAESDTVDHLHQQQMEHIARTRQAAEWMSTHEDGISSHISAVVIDIHTIVLIVILQYS